MNKQTKINKKDNVMMDDLVFHVLFSKFIFSINKRFMCTVGVKRQAFINISLLTQFGSEREKKNHANHFFIIIIFTLMAFTLR